MNGHGPILIWKQVLSFFYRLNSIAAAGWKQMGETFKKTTGKSEFSISFHSFSKRDHLIQHHRTKKVGGKYNSISKFRNVSDYKGTRSIQRPIRKPTFSQVFQSNKNTKENT